MASPDASNPESGAGRKLGTLLPSEKWIQSELPDPVFQGMVNDFKTFDETLTLISSKLDAFAEGIARLTEGLQGLSDGVVAELARTQDQSFISESCKLREATHQIARKDAPYSAVARFDKNLDFNIASPIKEHLEKNTRLKEELEKRELLLEALRGALKQLEECDRRQLPATDKRLLIAQAEFKASRASFNKLNRTLFEWLYILGLHRDDILDSCLQTLKYLQYEFFAASAHALSNVLPVRMEFRPMPEMVPECLEAQVQLELQSDEPMELDFSGGSGAAFAARLLQRLTRDNKSRAGAAPDEDGPPQPVDPMSLSSLLAHGFEEGPARRALRLKGNDTQAALDWLVHGGDAALETNAGVRKPVSSSRTSRLQELCRQHPELFSKNEGGATGPAPVGLGLSAAHK